MAGIGQMELADFVAGEGERPSVLAALQQAILIEALYSGDDSIPRQIFSTSYGYSLPRFVRNPQSLPPSYLVGVQGPDVYVVISGTSNAAQMLANFGGYLAAASHIDPTVKANAFWTAALDAIYVDILTAILGVGANPKVYWSGHSYGAAVSMLGSINYLLGDRVHREAEWMGLGAPKVLTIGGSYPQPNPAIRWSTEEDPVAKLPDDASDLINPVLPAGIPFAGRLSWVHLGRQQVIDRRSRVYNDFAHPSSAYYLLSLGIEPTFAAHSIGTYIERLATAAKQATGNQQTRNQIDSLMQARAKSVLAAPPVAFVPPPAVDQVLTPESVNATYYAGETIIESAAQLAFGAVFNLEVEDVIVPPPPDAGGPNVLSGNGAELMGPAGATQITMSFSTPQEDVWSEIMFAETGGSALQNAFSVDRAIIQNRLKLLSPQYTLTRVKFTAVDGTRAQSSKTIMAAGKYATPGPASVASVAAICALRSADGVASRHLFLSGLDSTAIFYDLAGRLFMAPGFDTIIKQYFAALEAASLVIPYVKKRTTPNYQFRAVTQVDGSSPGMAILYVPNGHGLTFPDPNNPPRVILSRFSAKDLPALNGRFEAVNFPIGDTTHFSVRYQVPNNATWDTDTGRMRWESYVWNAKIAAANCEVISLNHRDRKNGLTGSRGRKRATVRRSSA